VLEGRRKDASFEEFMEVMQPKAKVVPWVDPSPSSSEKDKATTTQGGSQDPQEVQRELTDMEWMQQRMSGRIGDADVPREVFEQSDGEEQVQAVSEEKSPADETILRTARLFVRNLTFTCTEEELRQLFQPFGMVSQVRRIYLLR
jgi:multiple RNA-binding domain-containing protein 1